MESSGGCCIAMSGVARGGAGGDPTRVAWRMGRIMLRYRPIAPKPVASGASPAIGGLSETVCGRRSKRRRASSGRGRGRKAKKVEDQKGVSAPPEKKEEAVKSPPNSSSSSTISLSSSMGSEAALPSLCVSETSATLRPLMPEAPDHVAQSPPPPKSNAPPPWFCKDDVAGEAIARPRPVRSGGSWVTVECLTDAWRDGEVVAPNDEALRKLLEMDLCPGFITDQRDLVTWVSEAYRRMVTGFPQEEDANEEQVTVCLVTRGHIPAAGMSRAFTCRVRVRYASHRKGKVSLTAPCDVWRLADGGCAWRLDIKAALSLGIRNEL